MKTLETDQQTTNEMLQQMVVTLQKMEARMCTKTDLVEIFQEADTRIIAHLKEGLKKRKETLGNAPSNSDVSAQGSQENASEVEESTDNQSKNEVAEPSVAMRD